MVAAARQRRAARREASWSWLATVLLTAGAARAEGVALRPDVVRAGDIKLDGVPREWPSPMTPLARALVGHNKRVTMRAAAVYDDAHLYVAADLRDERLVRTASCGDTEDHAVLLLAFPRAAGGYDQHAISLFPGDPGKTAGCVKTKNGATVPSAKIVEAPKGKGSYTFEAQIPWATFPEAARTRVGLRAALRYVDGDGRSVAAIIGTANDGPPSEWPLFPLEAEQLMADGMSRQTNKGALRHDRVGDVAGDQLFERVLLFDRHLVVAGPHFRNGKEYYISDLGEWPAGSSPRRFDVRDVNGDGKAELIVHKRTGTATEWREVLLVMSMGTGEEPFVMFQHEVGLHTKGGTVDNQVAFGSDAGRPTIEITAGNVSGFSADNYREPVETTMEPVLLPWGPAKSQVFQWNGKSFHKIREDKQNAAAAPRAALPTSSGRETAEVPPSDTVAVSATPPTADERQEQVYTLYKREHRIASQESPRFDLAADVAEDARRERIVLHGRDLVVFGKGYRAGAGYTFLTLQPFSDPRDIVDVTARDLSGEGKAEVLVRGIMRVPAPRAAGLKRGATLDREVVLVYTVTTAGLTRAFGAETARVIGNKRIQGTIAFVREGVARAVDIELRPGRAYGFTEATYPFGQESAQPGGLVPVRLPWGDTTPARFHWDGSAFVR